ncbi:MAG: hypothetical protein WCO02_09280 [Bacteroidota bacterium]
MTVTTIDLYQILRTRIGEKEAKALVEFVELKVQVKLKEEMNSFATSSDIITLKGEITNVRDELHQVELRIEKVRSDLIKWMFVFWMGQISVTVALVMLLMK